MLNTTGINRLVIAIIHQAVKDVRNGDPGAAAWLKSPYCVELADLAGIDINLLEKELNQAKSKNKSA